MHYVLHLPTNGHPCSLTGRIFTDTAAQYVYMYLRVASSQAADDNAASTYTIWRALSSTTGLWPIQRPDRLLHLAARSLYFAWDSYPPVSIKEHRNRSTG
ncbi:hypothetical protein P3T76_011807 [Phytophthora citrophthora]|uniref:Uncharacterized protein n=1 Tax=Phytophthora citrophthora TaxID=4793 RepID=A0AAD9LEK6_9STRA|nr:hypothetical protein P3T76_011807 [Phytophthora citrophthora]